MYLDKNLKLVLQLDWAYIMQQSTWMVVLKKTKSITSAQAHCHISDSLVAKPAT